MTPYSSADFTPFQVCDGHLDDCMETSSPSHLYGLVATSTIGKTAQIPSRHSASILYSSVLQRSVESAMVGHVPSGVASPATDCYSPGRFGRPLRGLGIYLDDSDISNDQSGILSAIYASEQDMGLFGSPMDIDNAPVHSSPIRLPDFYDILHNLDSDSGFPSENDFTDDPRDDSEPLSKWFSEDGYYCLPPILTASKGSHINHSSSPHRIALDDITSVRSGSQHVMSSPLGRSPMISGLYADINMFASLPDTEDGFVRPQDIWAQEISPIARSSCLTPLATTEHLLSIEDRQASSHATVSPTPRVSKRNHGTMQSGGSPPFLPSCNPCEDDEEPRNSATPTVLPTTKSICSGTPVLTWESWIQIIGSSSESGCPSALLSNQPTVAQTSGQSAREMCLSAASARGEGWDGRVPFGSHNYPSQHRDRNSVPFGQAELKENIPPTSTEPCQVAAQDNSHVSDTLINNAHRGVEVENVVRRVSSFRNECPGERLPDYLLFTFAGKLSPAGRPIDGYRCYIVGCHKTTKRKDHMADHIRMHVGEKPYQCRTCGLGFIRNNDCQRHESNHSPNKRFVCGCHASFSRRDLFVRHLKMSCPDPTFADEYLNGDRPRKKARQAY